MKKLVQLKTRYFLDAVENSTFKLFSTSNPNATSAEINLETIKLSIEKAISFLIRQQKKQGNFKGFLLFPGASTCWLSAHVGFVLEDVEDAFFIRKKICEYLIGSMHEDGGWGYRRGLPIDMDSTAQALLLLHRMKFDFPDFILQNLVKSQSQEGGFPTYINSQENKNLWQNPHVDITIIAIELLKRLGGFAREINKAIEWLETQKNENGIYKSFWWDTNAYSIWMQEKTNSPMLISEQTWNLHADKNQIIPNISMMLPYAIKFQFATENILSMYKIILHSQLEDGSWICSPCLKVPNRKFENAACKIYGDDKRIFSTAHALNATFCMMKHLSRL